MLALVVFSDKYILSVKNGLELYAINVLPALFPFFFFSKILTELNLGYDLGNILKKPLKKFYNAPNLSGYILAISMLSGYPVGAKLVSDCYQNNLITAAEAKKILSFTSTSGPLFIVGTVGIAMLGSKKAGFVILLCHYLATLINGLVFRGKKEKICENTIKPPIINYDSILSNSMLSSITSVLLVGGYICIFNFVLDFLFDIKLIYIMANALTCIGVDARLSSSFFASIIEITKGSLMFGVSGFPLRTTIPLVCFCISFGGICVTLQSLTFLSRCKISPAYYLLTKTSQGILSYIIGLGCAFIFF